MRASIPFQQPYATAPKISVWPTSPSSPSTRAANANPSPKNHNPNTTITRKNAMSDTVDLGSARG